MKTNRIICGSAKEVLKTLPDDSINCCISSPPYWALRDYGVEGQLGLEPTFEEYIDKLCGIYDEVFRILRPDGTCWVNLGDSYQSHAGDYTKCGGFQGKEARKSKEHLQKYQGLSKGIASKGARKSGIPDKSLCLIPQRFAIEMVNRGWILRNCLIWHKPNPMPSSAKDRFTVDFEQVFFFTKSSNALCWVRPDGKMVSKQPDYKSGEQGLDWQGGIRKGKRVKLSLWSGWDYFFEPQYEPQLDDSWKRSNYIGHSQDSKRLPEGTSWRPDNYELNPLGRNKRTVWTIPTQSFSDAHFATFPEKLVEPMILAGCPKEVCTKCGQGRRKVYETESYITRPTTGRDTQKHKQKPEYSTGLARTGGHVAANHYFKGYTDCGCGAKFAPGVVLDPFWGRAPLARWLPSTDATGSESNSSRIISKWRSAA